MKAFMKSLTPSTSKKEKLIKTNLINKLSESVKYIQINNSMNNEYYGKENDKNKDKTKDKEKEDDLLKLLNDKDDDGNGSINLCTVIEGIFLHGLKDSFIEIATKALDVERVHPPEPSFWSLLLIFSHKQIINQIESLQQITNEIGECRAWIRIALNDHLLSSYLISIQRDAHILKQFYKSYAFLRDCELLDLTHNLINGIEMLPFDFNLPINSSLLNYWTHPPLLMSGLWSPSLKSCPISSGIDIAQSLDITTILQQQQETNITNVNSNNNSNRFINNGIGQLTALNEGEALRIILQKSTELNESTITELKQQQAAAAASSSSSSSSSNVNEVFIESIETNNSSGIGNSLSVVMDDGGWSSYEQQQQQYNDDSSSTSTTINNGNKTTTTIDSSYFNTESSYNTLIDNYYNVNMKTTLSSKLKWPIYEDNDNDIESKSFIDNNINKNDLMLQNLGYEVITSTNDVILSDDISLNEFNKFIYYLSRIATEKGLDEQKYICSACGNTLGISFGKPKLCSFTGEYYCNECISDELHIIPARIIFNWDFHKYNVSKRANIFLTEFKNHPLINIKKINPFIYSMINQMSELQSLRIQMNYLRAYLYTCREPIINQLQRKIWPREYLYETIHLYSISDLELMIDYNNDQQINQTLSSSSSSSSDNNNNKLIQQFQSIVKFGRNHVYKCWLCCQKGFICELCNVNQILYPFDLDITVRCDLCNTVFHRECFQINSTNECPKCERRRKQHKSID